jgi:hypothetical protein
VENTSPVSGRVARSHSLEELLNLKVKPEVVKAMGGTGRDPVFENDKGVVVRVTRKIKTDYGLYVSLLGDSFKVTLRDFQG